MTFLNRDDCYYNDILSIYTAQQTPQHARVKRRLLYNPAVLLRSANVALVIDRKHAVITARMAVVYIIPTTRRHRRRRRRLLRSARVTGRRLATSCVGILPTCRRGLLFSLRYVGTRPYIFRYRCRRDRRGDKY